MKKKASRKVKDLYDIRQAEDQYTELFVNLNKRVAQKSKQSCIATLTHAAGERGGAA